MTFTFNGCVESDQQLLMYSRRRGVNLVQHLHHCFSFFCCSTCHCHSQCVYTLQPFGSRCSNCWRTLTESQNSASGKRQRQRQSSRSDSDQVLVQACLQKFVCHQHRVRVHKHGSTEQWFYMVYGTFYMVYIHDKFSRPLLVLRRLWASSTPLLTALELPSR